MAYSSYGVYSKQSTPTFFSASTAQTKTEPSWSETFQSSLPYLIGFSVIAGVREILSPSSDSFFSQEMEEELGKERMMIERFKHYLTTGLLDTTNFSYFYGPHTLPQK